MLIFVCQKGDYFYGYDKIIFFVLFTFFFSIVNILPFSIYYYGYTKFGLLLILL